MSKSRAFIRGCVAAIFTFFLLFVSAAVCRNSYAAGVPEKKIVIVFRYDDYSSFSRTDIEKKIFDVFRKYGFRLTVSVIPYICDEDIRYVGLQGNLPLIIEKIAMLKDAIKDGAIDVAMHGYTHQAWRGDMSGGYSEFDGVEYAIQLQKINDGRKMLENMLGMEVGIFVPPWNSYDANTLWALEEAGFRCISSESGDEVVVSKLDYLPATCPIGRLREAVEAARKVSDPEPIIIAGFHESSFSGSEYDNRWISFDDFSSLFDWISTEKDIRVLSVGELIKTRNDLKDHRAKEYNDFCNSFRLLPKWMYPSNSLVYFVSIDDHKTGIIFWTMVTILYYCLIAFMAFLIVYYSCLVMAVRSNVVLDVFKMICGGAFLLAAAYALRDLGLNEKGLLVISALAGVNVGLWIFYWRKVQK